MDKNSLMDDQQKKAIEKLILSHIDNEFDSIAACEAFCRDINQILEDVTKTVFLDTPSVDFLVWPFGSTLQLSNDFINKKSHQKSLTKKLTKIPLSRK